MARVLHQGGSQIWADILWADRNLWAKLVRRMSSIIVPTFSLAARAGILLHAGAPARTCAHARRVTACARGFSAALLLISIVLIVAGGDGRHRFAPGCCLHTRYRVVDG